MAPRTTTRRRLIRTASLAALAGLAGCSGSALPGGEPSTEGSPTPESTPMGSPTPAETATEQPTASPSDETVTPHSIDSQHLHGTLVMTINGETYHFGDKPWNMEERTGIKYFHFHTDEKQDTWHVHAKGVTLGYAIGTMPKLQVDGMRVTFRGYEYDGNQAGTDVSITVNGRPVDDLDGYLLEEGDAVEIAIQTDAATPTPSATPTETPSEY